VLHMNILVTGGSGFIGRQLTKLLLSQQHQVIVLTRSRNKTQALLPARCVLVESLDEIPQNLLPHAVINLAGEAIADKYWSVKRKHLLRISRIQFTKNLVDWIMEHVPDLKVMISGSALGYYGSQEGAIALTESSAAVEGFTHQLCKDWEFEALRLESIGCRVCLLRTGLVLGNDGGALAKMLPAFKYYLGGPVASGQQVMSWIHMDDMIHAIVFLLNHSHAKGAYNITSPHAVNNLEFSLTLAKLLHRPAIFRVPVFILRLMLGEGAELLVQGQRVIPERLQKAGFKFSYPHLKGALTAIIGK